MPTHPTPEGSRSITIELKEHLVEHVDRERQFIGMSRAAYIRNLIAKDIQRQGPGRAAAAQG
jgi:metal-responsive CopG/Arc/MetJ family transcriptional regulator